MNINFNHYKEFEIEIDGPVKMKFPDSKDITYHDMCKMLHMEESLEDFFHEHDTISTEVEDGMIIFFYKRVDEKEPRPVFCFSEDNKPNGQIFYHSFIQFLKEAYAEELI